MTPKILDQPPPTPNPDEPDPHPRGGEGFEPVDAPPEEASSHEPSHDSVYDDLGVLLTGSNQGADPDPYFESADVPPLNSSSSDDDAVPDLLGECKKPPRTSEVFRSMVSGTDAMARGACDPDVSQTSLTETSSRVETGIELDPQLNSLANSADGRAGHDPADDERDDDRPSESGLSWKLILLLSYSSAVTVALAWILWTGRSFQHRENPEDSVLARPEAPGRDRETPEVALPPIPAENLANLGQTIRLGDLEVTPLDISLAKVRLLRSIKPTDFRREAGHSLVVRLRLTNISEDHTIHAMELAFVREHASRLEDSYISTPEGRRIGPFPLAVESEWSILGEEFTPLEPGQTMETIVTSEAISTDRLSGEMIWRIHLRIGVYRTDMLGVRFRKQDVKLEPRGNNRDLEGSDGDSKLVSPE